MKFMIEDIGLYKKAIAMVCSLSSKKINNPIEQCIQIEASKGLVRLTCVESDSHSLTLEVPAVVSESGSCYVLGSKIANMTKKLSPKVVLTAVVSNGNITYKLPILGSISEPLFHDQSGFKDSFVLADSDDFKEVCLSSELLPALLRTACSSSFSSKSILLMGTQHKLSIYSQFSETGYIKYLLPARGLDLFNVYVNPSLLKMAASLGVELAIFFNKKNRIIRFRAEDGAQLSIVGDSLETKSHAVLDKLLDIAPSGYAIVNHADITSAVDWQAYNASIGQSLDLNMKDGDLLVKGSKDNEAAKIGCDQAAGFAPISIPLHSFSLALKAIGNCKNAVLQVNSVNLEERTHKIGDKEVRLLTVSPSDDIDTMGTALIYEQAKISK